MAIRWNEYRSRRALIDLSKCFENWGVKTYTDLSYYLLSIGVIPPSRDHEDVQTLDTEIIEVTQSLATTPKPGSGRKVDAKGMDKTIAESITKPSSGRKITSNLESSTSKKRKPPTKKASRTSKKAAIGTKKKSSRKTASKDSSK